MESAHGDQFADPKIGDFNEGKLLSKSQEKMKIDAVRHQEEPRRPIDSVDDLLKWIFTPGWDW